LLPKTIKEVKMPQPLAKLVTSRTPQTALQNKEQEITIKAIINSRKFLQRKPPYSL